MNLDSVRDRARRCEQTRGGEREVWHLACVASAADVPALLEYVQGLRAEAEHLRGELIEEQTVHAKTFDNFEAEAESWLEERTRLLDRCARLEQQVDHLRASKAAQVKHLTGQIEAARAEL